MKIAEMKNCIEKMREIQKQISELESELEHKKEHIKALNGMLGIRTAKENIELANKMYGLNFEVPDDEEPLPFSGEGDRIDKLEKRIAHLEDWLPKEIRRLEQKIILENLRYDR